MLRTKTLAAAILAVTVGLLSGCDRPSEPVRPEPDIVDWFTVNTATYNYDDMVPVHDAFTRVARWRGWTDAEIEAWRPFVVEDIIRKESHGCYNVRALNPRFVHHNGAGCLIARNGRQQDAGFGQVVLRFNAWLCEQEGYCTPEDITLTAWDSMNATLAVVERGVGAWNYDARSRRIHPTLRYAPSTPPNQD